MYGYEITQHLKDMTDGKLMLTADINCMSV